MFRALFGRGMTVSAFYLSKEDTNSYLRQVLVETARRVGIKDTEWKPSDELHNEVQQAHPVAYRAFEAFTVAYSIWYDVASQWDDSGKAQAMDELDRDYLGRLVAKRDEARKALLGVLESAS